MNDIDKGLMRKYADIVNEEKALKESIESGVCEVVQSRLVKTMGMVENLMLDLKSDEEARDTVSALSILLNTLQEAWSQVDDVITTTVTGNVKGMPNTDVPAFPMADPTGTLKRDIDGKIT